MGWVSIDEAAWKAHHEKLRDEFTWEDAARDLALETNLTLGEARWLTTLEEVGIHPYDACQSLKLFFQMQSMQGKISALIEIIKLAKGEQ